MPKVKLSRLSEQEYPPIDWLWAAVLERMKVMKLDLSDLAGIAGIHYELMRQRIRVSPWSWPDKERESVCKALGIKAIRTVEGAPREDWRE